jgi:hypothetical protein
MAPHRGLAADPNRCRINPAAIVGLGAGPVIAATAGVTPARPDIHIPAARDVVR